MRQKEQNKQTRDAMFSRLPSTKELHAFLITAEEQNFTAAAQRLNLTQGAVSRQIGSLEQKLDVTLFQRHARGLTLTTKGHTFMASVESILNQLQRAVEQISYDKQKLKLKAPSCITPWLLPKLMNFQQAHPEIDVELTSTIKHQINFTAESFDAAIGYGDYSRNSENLLADLLFEEVLTPMCSPDLLTGQRENESFDLANLSALTWLHATPQKSDWDLWLTHASKALQQPQLIHLTGAKNQHFATLDLSVNAAIQQFGITIGDVTLAQQEIELGRLVTPHPLQITSGKGYYLVRPKSTENESLNRLIAWLCKEVDVLSA